MNWKLSHYLVVSEPFANGRYQVLYSTRTASKLLLTAPLVEKILRNDLTGISEEIRSVLIAKEIVVPVEEDELTTIISRNTRAVAENETLYFVIQPTAQCQLGCHYCGQQHTSTYLGDELNTQIIQRVQEKLAKGHYTKLQIGWFGAEPLLGAKQIEKLTPALRSLAEQYGCTYQAKVITNGLNLKKPLFLRLVGWDIKSIEVTLDGPAAYHDQRRATKSGHATFDIIFTNLKNLLSAEDFASYGVEIILRCNVDTQNYQGVPQLIDLLSQHNLLAKISDFYFAPIHAWGNDAHLQALGKEEFARHEINWIVALQQKGFVREQVPSETKPIVCLSLQPEAEVIDAKGNVYNCSELPYVPGYEKSEYLLENLLEPRVREPNQRSFTNWYQEILDGQFPCHHCKILPICGGACPKSWHEQISPCPSIKFNIKERLLADSYASLKKRITPNQSLPLPS